MSLVWPTYCRPYILHGRHYTRLWLLQQTERLEGNFRPSSVDLICPVVSRLWQYLHEEVVQILFDLPVLPNWGSRGRLERTNMFLNLGLRLAPQINLPWKRKLVRSEIPRIIQFCFKSCLIFYTMLEDQVEILGYGVCILLVCSIGSL